MPLWAVSLDWELRRGRQVIMNGQIRDRWWFADRPASFRVVVARQLERRGAETVGWWDPVGGLTFPLPGHEERFDQLREGPASRRPPADGAADGAPPDTTGTGPPDGRGNPEGAPDGEPGTARSRRGGERDRGRERLLAPRPSGRPRTFEDVVATAHRLVASPDAATAFVFEDVDHHLPPGQNESRLGYLRLRAAMTEAVTPRSASGPAPHARNAVLCAVGDIGRLPGWFHLEDPGSPPCTSARPTRASGGCG